MFLFKILLIKFKQIENKLNPNFLNVTLNTLKNPEIYTNFDFKIFCLEKTIVVTLKMFEQIIPLKLWPNFITTLSLYYLYVYGLLDVAVGFNCFPTNHISSGAMTSTTITNSIMTLSIISFIATPHKNNILTVILGAVMLNTQRHYTECHYGDCHFTECCVECHFGECHFGECCIG